MWKIFTRGKDVWPSQAEQKRLAQEACDFLTSKSVALIHICGLLAQEEAESQFETTALGDRGLVTRKYHACGIFQWWDYAADPTKLDNSRIGIIKEKCKIDLRTFPPHLVQWNAAWWELNNPEKHAWQKILTATTAYEAGALASEYWIRPRKDEGDKRGKLANNWYQFFVGHK